MSNLEERIQKIEDRFAIEDLVSRYFVASDDNDFEVLEDSFAKDGIFTGPGFSGGSNRAEVMEFVRAFRANVGQTVHALNSVTVEFLDADRATGVVGAHIELSMGGRTLFGAFRYYDDYVREEGRWRFARRELLTVHVGRWEDIGTSLTCENSVRWPGSEPLKSHFPRER
ncbi:nuclear transport factor 2 family protein [Sphingobium phenoxybenzoativorans]|uniref:Nuclear transport factor 2 family protein n=1 Tax=Sphingobium phenoxybenzoativorans TaxID=1592790 RepID=A0A975Q2V1_9SPHN|nr:nuclear transport factor 2 family protein [Sphingobium phenoxybenzoativorans]QUT06852.1 nuclear transport factor 2 family protein [Sphingobium phenoxybenzoativorans]